MNLYNKNGCLISQIKINAASGSFKAIIAFLRLTVQFVVAITVLDMAEKWKDSGLVKLEGIPAPSGNYEVGCTHLMHQDLQMRLYYPTEKDLAATFVYAKYYPHPNYLKASLDVIGVPLPGLVSGVLRLLSGMLFHT